MILSDYITFSKFGHQIYIEILIGGGWFLLLVHDADHVIVKSQSVRNGQVAYGPLVVLRHIHRLARVLTWWRIREVLQILK